MSKTIKVTDDTKERFKDLQPTDHNQDEYVAALLDVWETREHGPTLEELVERLEATVASKTELAAHRGVKSALEDETP